VVPRPRPRSSSARAACRIRLPQTSLEVTRSIRRSAGPPCRLDARPRVPQRMSSRR
jgi:hypothetical protein